MNRVIDRAMPNARENIVLIGFASTGKSTTGRSLAQRLGWGFVDLDDIVEALHIEEKGEKRRCREIFNLFGRECFINYETRAIERLREAHHTIIATGGGTPISEINRPMTKALGITVYLNARVEAIFDRMAGKGYPEYLGPDPTLNNLRQLWETRHEIYAGLADITVDNTDTSPEETAGRIIEAYNNLSFSSL